jgi:hypothetical protein
MVIKQQTPGIDMSYRDQPPIPNEKDARRVIDQKLGMSGWEIISIDG